MWDFFSKTKPVLPPYQTDLHSHLLPNLDDGVKSFEESATIIKMFLDYGFNKAITTPHIMHDYYRNTHETISKQCAALKQYLTTNKIPFEIQFAAEYYFDENVMNQLNGEEDMLTFGEKYLLFETNTYSEPMLLNDFIFQLKVKGYTPVMAHPERYQYLHNNLNRIEDLINRGVLMQVNTLSLIGHYSKPIQKIATHLIDKKLVHFLGSDCHNIHHAELMRTVLKNKYFQKALELPLLNYSL